MIARTESAYAHAIREAQAALAGGARLTRCRGCRLISVLAFLSATSVQADQSLPVPSGQPVFLSEVLLDENPGSLWARFRFVAPKIGDGIGEIGYDVTALDMDHLCDILVLPYLETHAISPSRIVISFSGQPVAFGDSAPDVTQYFGAYRSEGAGCEWEEF